ncbi:MAG TPA: hypothetical protein VF659_21900 [Pyrinomonadaceae bacterium]|jgi:hypothetical protein
MGRRKRDSAVLEQARSRLNALKGIDPALDLGNGLTVNAFEQVIDALGTKLDGYNQKLSEADEALFEVENNERTVKDLNSRFLAGIGARFGRNSVQYEKVGGIRTDDRKQPTRKKDNGDGSPPET